MRVKVSPGVAVATAAAVLFSSALATTAFAGSEGSNDKIHCSGVNSCKGQSACASANNACKGQNSCKGQGFLELTKEECKAAQDEQKSTGK